MEATTQQPVKYDVTTAAIEGLRTKWDSIPDASTRDGYETIRIGIGEIRALRVNVEKRRKALKADALAYGRAVDAKAKEITTALLEIEAPLKDAKQGEDDRKAEIKAEKERIEQARVDAIQAKIQEIANVPFAYQLATADKIAEAIGEVDQINTDNGDYAEFSADASAAKIAALQRLNELRASAIQRAEQERIRREEEARLAEERRKLAAERERLAAEDAKRRREAAAEEQKRRAEEAKRQAEAEAKLTAEREALRKRQEEIERREREEAARKAAAEAERARKETAAKDAAARAQRHAETVVALADYCPDPEALYAAIETGEIPHVRVAP